MDTVTYPDKDVQEVAKSFICIRVEYDQNPELVKKYGVKSLTDVRLIDAEGREVEKLIGFTSPERLAARCKAALEGRTSEKKNERAARKIDVSQENVDAAIKKGLDHLRGARKKGWKKTPGFEPGELILFAWASCGLTEKDEEVRGLAEVVAKTPPAGTYQAALRALALSRLDGKKYREALQDCAAFLIRTQLENGQWSYTPPKDGAPPKLGDNSNTAYALLGLSSCRKAGIEVPAAPLRKVEKWWRDSQRNDGGWGYRTDREIESYAGMTESGISALLLCGVAKDAALDRAVSWVTDHFSVSENSRSAYQQGRLLYHLFALERVGTLLKTEKIGPHDWWNEGASYLLSTQGEDGSWDDGADTPIPNTCFALLFLTRATQFLR